MEPPGVLPLFIIKVFRNEWRAVTDASSTARTPNVMRHRKRQLPSKISNTFVENIQVCVCIPQEYSSSRAAQSVITLCSNILQPRLLSTQQHEIWTYIFTATEQDGSRQAMLSRCKGIALYLWQKSTYQNLISTCNEVNLNIRIKWSTFSAQSSHSNPPTCARTHVCIRVRLCTRVCVHAYINSYVHAYANTHAYINSPADERSLLY